MKKSLNVLTIILLLLISCSSDDSSNKTSEGANDKKSLFIGEWQLDRIEFEEGEQNSESVNTCRKKAFFEFKEDNTFEQIDTNTTFPNSNADAIINCEIFQINGTFTIKEGDLLENIENPGTQDEEFDISPFEFRNDNTVLVLTDTFISSSSVTPENPEGKTGRKYYYNKIIN